MTRYFLIFFLFPLTIYSQVTENWTRVSLNESPQWIGKSDMFFVNTELNRLDLRAPEESSSAFLFTTSESISNAEWNFSVTLDFNPSSSNYCLIYLCSNQSEVNESLEGFYVKIGDTSDNVSLWKQKEGELVKLIDGTEGLLNLSGFKLNVKVTRDDKGNWNLYSSLNDNEFLLEGEVFDDDIYSCAFYGLFCKFTATRRDKFHFGSIRVTGDPYSDFVPPEIVTHNLYQGKVLQLAMSENVNTETLKIKVNDVTVAIDGVSSKGDSVEVEFKDKLRAGSNGSIAISGIKDLYGNTQRDTVLCYSYFKPCRYDVVISEILVDPNPVVALPECEFVELYNQTDRDIHLDLFHLVINDKEVLLPEYTLKSHDYTILVNETKAGYYDMNNVIPVHSFPVLNNSGGTIVVVNNENSITDAVEYPFTGISLGFKGEGGWSLEKMDLSNQDLSSYNWGYSVDLNGGTPGYENSNKMINEDISNPLVTFISYNDEYSFTINFSEAIDTSCMQLSNFEIAQHSVRDIEIDSVFFTYSTLYLNQPLDKRTKTGISISNTNVVDLNGNHLSDDYLWKVGVPETVDSFDLCVNEVLFNPQSGGQDFIEIYNRSDKIICLDDIYLANILNNIPEKLYPVSSNHQLFFPGEYWVFCEDASVLALQYDIVEQQVVECELPSLNDDKGNIAIVARDGQIIDFFEYTEKMHYELLNSQEGVSLERLSVEAPTNNSNNWHSASTEVGYATPTCINSQVYSDNNFVKDKWIWLEEDTFSPNSDGVKDFILINYKMSEAGYLGTVRIYNRNGMLVQTLCDNSLLSAEGFLQWNGIQSNHLKAPMGIYIIYAEAFSLKGDVKHQKMVCVVTNGSRK